MRLITEPVPAVAKLLACLLAAAFALGAEAGPCPTEAFLDVGQYAGAGEGYPKPRLAVECDDDTLVVSSNAIPHYEFVQITPNPLVELNRDYRFPLRPTLAETPSPLSLLGPSGVAINGIPLFGPNEGPVPYPGFGDPIYNAIMDRCMGHTARQYHYHALVESCLGVETGPVRPSPILAFAADGFPVYGPFGCADEDCSEVIEFKSSWEQLRTPEIDAWDAYRFVPKSEAEYLDRCNGHSGDDHGGKYHYHATSRWPYILGCFSGTPSADAGREEDRQFSDRGRRRGAPPVDPRPSLEQIEKAAEQLGIDSQDLAYALGVTEDRVTPTSLASTARTLGIDYRSLSEALGVEPQPTPGPRARRRGPRGARGGPGQGPPPRRRSRPESP